MTPDEILTHNARAEAEQATLRARSSTAVMDMLRIMLTVPCPDDGLECVCIACQAATIIEAVEYAQRAGAIR